MQTGMLDNSVAAVPAGRWGIGVSGGADSVALLMLLRGRPDVHCHVIHLDHQTRGPDSTGDAAFVDALAQILGIERTIARRSEIEPGVPGLPANPSSRYRTLRFWLFQDVVGTHSLDGVILAHHADDQAETVVQRLARGSPPAGLGGMSADARVGTLRVLRPLLAVPADSLRDYLRQQGQAWREDASNASPIYQRNRVRGLLRARPELARHAREMGRAMADLTAWARACAPLLGETFAVRELADWPDVLAAQAARRWLAQRGSPVDELSGDVVARLVEMTRDAATPGRQDFPGPIRVARRAGRVGVA